MNITAEMRTLLAKIGARDRTIARLEAELKDKRDALALEIMAHEKTVEALRVAEKRLRQEIAI